MDLIPSRQSGFSKLTIILSILLIILSSCNLPTEDVDNMDYGNPVDFWVVNTGEIYLCPDPVSYPSNPPSDFEDESPNINQDTIDITNENIVKETTDPKTGITTQQLDLDGDGQPDIVHRYDKNGNLKDKREMDQGGVVVWAHHDAATGYTWKWVDTDGDGKPNVRRRYDKLGDMKTEKFLPDTITGTAFDNSTGTTTEQIDTDKDGKPDLERKYDRDGNKIDEKPLINQGDGAHGVDPNKVRTEWVDLDDDGNMDVVRRWDDYGELIDERPLDKLRPVTDSDVDPNTGHEIKYVDLDNDDNPDEIRVYDKNGVHVDTRDMNGKLIKKEFNEKTGETTLWIDKTGDGKPDIKRKIKYDKYGAKIDETVIDKNELGNAVGMSLDQSTGYATIYVDENGDQIPDQVIDCDPFGILVAQYEVGSEPSTPTLRILDELPGSARKLGEDYQESQNDPEEPPAPEESIPSASGEACAVFEEVEILTMIVRHMRDCTPTLNFHFKMDTAVPGLASESPIAWDYSATVNGRQATCFLEEGFEDRLYCRVDISADEAYTLGHFELYANPCQEAISVLDQTLPKLEGCEDYQTAPDEPMTEPDETEDDS